MSRCQDSVMTMTLDEVNRSMLWNFRRRLGATCVVLAIRGSDEEGVALKRDSGFETGLFWSRKMAGYEPLMLLYRGWFWTTNRAKQAEKC